MLINFLDPKLSPKVTCSTPSMDNYEVTNLISDNPSTRMRGFLAYSTIKPPVNIDFEMICRVNVHYIVLTTVLGTQKSTGIEILIKVNSQFMSVSQANTDGNGVIFCNSKFYSKEKPPPDVPQNYKLSFFKSNLFRLFTNVDMLRIKIVRTEKSVPCLARAEIWGKVSKTCSEITFNTIKHLVNRDQLQNLVPSNKRKAQIEEFEVPEEFLDALTFEVMSIPITLPSGNTVDESTLEKYIANEASHGRHPSDPFTGQRFTDCRKPVLNTSLKTRIDMFLLNNSHRRETFNVKRTLGRKIKPIMETKAESENQTADVINDDNNCEKCVNIRKTDSKSAIDDDNLDELIRRTMNSKSFVNFSLFKDSDAEPQPSKVNCFICKADKILYTLPCQHIYCKECLLVIYQVLRCKICNEGFLKNDVVKYNA